VNLTANRTVTLDSSRSVGYLTIGDTNGTHSYTLTGAPNATLTFDHTPNFGFTGILTQSAGSAGDNIAANIVIGNVNYLSVRNDSAAPLTISGGISSSNGVKTIQFDGTGSFLVSGVISNGGTGNSVQVGASGGGILTLTGTNTYTGGTTALNSSTILINGDSSGAIGQVSVVNSGTLGGTGTIGGSVSVGNGTITGGTDTTVGTLTIGTVTLHQNVSFQGGESFGTYLVNLAGSTSDKLAITGSLDLHFFDQITFSGMADGTTTYVLATYESHNGVFDSVLNLPAGYSLVYLGTELDLVPTAIPEPATWIGGALALGAIVCAKRKRSRVIG
jgi:fibronectin-binding autotransporter adhesin